MAGLVHTINYELYIIYTKSSHYALSISIYLHRHYLNTTIDLVQVVSAKSAPAAARTHCSTFVHDYQPVLDGEVKLDIYRR